MTTAKPTAELQPLLKALDKANAEAYAAWHVYKEVEDKAVDAALVFRLARDRGKRRSGGEQRDQ